MEATPQATQRAITLASLALVQVRRPEVQTFNELLVQYSLSDRTKKGQVVPDNMVVVWPEPIKAFGSYDVPCQPTAPFLMLEYVSKGSKRKDYEENFQKYERELRVPYYLLFYPDVQELTLYRLHQDRCESVKPNAAGRYPIAELELETGLVEGWARFWFRGELLPLPAELLRRLDKMDQQLEETTRWAETEKQRADTEKQRACWPTNALTRRNNAPVGRATRRPGETTRLLAEQEDWFSCTHS